MVNFYLRYVRHALISLSCVDFRKEDSHEN